MLLKVFSVYDSKLGAHFNPFYVAHLALAKRAFTATANDPNTTIHAHPGDFTLMEIAEWNDETGEFASYPKPINHGHAALYQVKSNGKKPPEQIGDEAHVQRGSEG